MKQIQMWNEKKTFLWGTLESDGKFSLYTEEGRYGWGEIKNGKVDFWHSTGGHSLGQVREGEKIEIQDRFNGLMWGDIR
jgi:hypothetical protein